RIQVPAEQSHRLAPPPGFPFPAQLAPGTMNQSTWVRIPMDRLMNPMAQMGASMAPIDAAPALVVPVQYTHPSVQGEEEEEELEEVSCEEGDFSEEAKEESDAQQ
ncbi:hypothetical protein PFISCL1PPCAC_9571, partial [Pristionchus fissidentatus]